MEIYLTTAVGGYTDRPTTLVCDIFTAYATYSLRGNWAMKLTVRKAYGNNDIFDNVLVSIIQGGSYLSGRGQGVDPPPGTN